MYSKIFLKMFHKIYPKVQNVIGILLQETRDANAPHLKYCSRNEIFRPSLACLLTCTPQTTTPRRTKPPGTSTCPCTLGWIFGKQILGKSWRFFRKLIKSSPRFQSERQNQRRNPLLRHAQDVTVCDYDMIGSGDPIGKIYLGWNQSKGYKPGFKHWKEVRRSSLIIRGHHEAKEGRFVTWKIKKWAYLFKI